MRIYTRKLVVKRYRFDGNKLSHRVRAEKALGRALPPGAQVHHADGTKSDDSPLVICQDQAYHSLLHVRTRVYKAGGDPDRHRICTDCKAVTLIEDMGKRTPDASHKTYVSNQCKACIRKRANNWYACKVGKVVA
jgi:hypothetical protein